MLFSVARGSESTPVRGPSRAPDYGVRGGHPFGFHLTNIVPFAPNCTCFGTIAHRRIEGLPAGRDAAPRPRAPELALVATLFFGAHPIRSEVVGFAACRNALLGGWVFLLRRVPHAKQVSAVSRVSADRGAAAGRLSGSDQRATGNASSRPGRFPTSVSRVTEA